MTRSSIMEQFQAYREEIRKRFLVEIVAIFGSYARGEQTVSSDLDVLYRVISPEFGLLELDELEEFIKNIAEVPSVDLVNEQYINPVIELEMREELVYV